MLSPSKHTRLQWWMYWKKSVLRKRFCSKLRNSESCNCGVESFALWKGQPWVLSQDLLILVCRRSRSIVFSILCSTWTLRDFTRSFDSFSCFSTTVLLDGDFRKRPRTRQALCLELQCRICVQFTWLHFCCTAVLVYFSRAGDTTKGKL